VCPATLDSLRARIKGIRARILGHTPAYESIVCKPELRNFPRAAEIETWRRTNERVEEEWIAIDDRPDWFLPNEPRLIRCETAIGFDEKAEVKMREQLQDFAL
jgi:hypothetical protein